jgi:acyl carrier protein
MKRYLALSSTIVFMLGPALSDLAAEPHNNIMQQMGQEIIAAKDKAKTAEDLRADAKALIIGVIVNQLKVSRDMVTPGARIVDDLGADSLDMVELVMELEKTFHIRISNEEMEKIRTVQDVYNCVTRNRQNQ